MGGRDPEVPDAARPDLARMLAAGADGNWPSVIATGGAILDTWDLPDEAAARIRLEVGAARFMLGQHRPALAQLAAGLLDTPPDDLDDLRPYAYWAGMAAQIVGDLDQARRYYAITARDASPDDGEFPVGAARRALAQLEIEAGDLDVALDILQPLMEWEPDPMTRVLHAVATARVGRLADAQMSLHLVVEEGEAYEDAADPAEQATIATVLVIAAEVYVELGHAVEAARAIAAAERRWMLAGQIQSTAARTLPVLRADVARLRGELLRAERALAEVTPRDDEPELVGAHHRTRARVAWARGDAHRAATAYQQAIDAFAAMGYGHQADAARAEARMGPPPLTTHPDMRDVLHAMTPEVSIDAEVQLVLPLSAQPFGGPGEVDALQDAVRRWEPVVNAVGGELDGWLTGGGEFTVYLYGDADRVWPAIEQDARRLAARAGGGHVRLRRVDDVERIDLVSGRGTSPPPRGPDSGYGE